MRINLANNFKWLFIISLVWLLLEGIFRKWLFFSLAGPIFYIKYFLFALTYLTFLLKKYPIPKAKYLFQFMIILYIVICLVGLTTNKLNNPLIIGVIGLVVHLLFVPIIHINQYLFNSLKKINILIKWLVYLSFPICILGMVQFYLPTDHFLNGFTNEEQLISRVDQFTRIASIFSFVKIYNAYLLFSITIITVAILNKLLNNKSIFIYVISLFLLIINMFMTGSRLPIGLMLLNFLAISGYVFFSISKLRKTIFIIFFIGIITTVILYFSTNLVKDPIDATIARTEKAESRHRSESTGFTDIQLRFQDRIDIFKFSESSGWFGYGIGMAYQGSVGFIKKPIPFYFEEEGERVVLELGIIGGLVIVLMRLSILFFALSFLFWCKSVEIKLLLLALFLYITPAIITIQMTTFSYLENFFYYFSIGLIIALYKIYQHQSSLKE